MNPTPANCITCAGRKTFKWWSHADPSITSKAVFTAEFECPCLDQWILNRYLLHANVSARYQVLSWKDAVGVEPGAVEFVANYVENIDAYRRAGMGLVLRGETNGTGKTLLVTLMVKQLLARGVDCYLLTFSEMIDRLADGWKGIEAQQWFQRRVKNASVLVVDDIGKEYQGKKHGGLPEATFDAVLRHRVASMLPTLFTTNYDLEVLTRDYKISVMSLLSECCDIYEMQGENFRDKSRIRSNEEIKQRLTRPRVLA